MVMVIVRLLLGENHRLQSGQAVKTNSPRLKTTPFHVRFKRIEPFFPRTRGIPRVDDRRVVSGIVHVIRNGLRWRDAPAVHGPHKTLYNRFRSLVPHGYLRPNLRQPCGRERPARPRDDRQRHKVENMFARLKDWRRISMRYDRCAHTFSALSASRQPLSFGSVNES
jgi:transposase